MNKLLLLSGNDLPFIGGRMVIHQPKIKEIAFIGQDIFYLGSNFLCFSKNNLSEQDKISLEKHSDFDILMSIINTNAQQIKHTVSSAKILLSLIFPQYQLKIMPNMLLFNKQINGQKQQGMVNNDNYEQFRQIIKQMFCLDLTSQQKFNPANKKAAQIAKKLEQRKKKLSQKKDSSGKQINILYHYISVLALGNHHTIPQLMEYTVYQLFNEFQRFQKKFAYDTWFSAKLAGAEGLDDVDNWISEEDHIISSEQRPKSNRIEF